MLNKIKVLIVDDSAVVRQTLKQALLTDPNIEIAGMAPDPYIARDMLVEHKPDVITLDIEMPRMDGITFLRKIMKYVPTPVVIISSLTRNNSELSLQAFEFGAVEVLAKPENSYSLGTLAQELVHKVKAAARAETSNLVPDTSAQKTPISLAQLNTTHKLIVMGASTGGTRAIETVLTRLPANLPGVVIVQHMPPVFTSSFAQSLNRVSPINVKEAEHGERILPGYAYVAPGGYHLLVNRSGADYVIELRSGPQINYQKPAVDVLFKSAARHAGQNTLGILFTGMGSDGAQGMQKLKESGATTYVQDERSCVVYGMPRAAIEINAHAKVVPLDGMPEAIGAWMEANS